MRPEVLTLSTGPPEGVWGHVAALMDELLGVTCVMCGHGGYTGTLKIRYLSPTRWILNYQEKLGSKLSMGAKQSS